jgi:hypothetical protein
MAPSRILAALALFTAAASQPLSIEECTPAFAPEAFTVNADGTLTSGGLCVGFDGDSVQLAACTSGPEQQWTFHPDGTVESVKASGHCWNVNGGSTGAGTGIIMYACGSRDVAANDVFWPLPSLPDGTRHVLANESGMCVSSSAPPFTCAGDECCSLNGEWDGSSCTCYAPWVGTNCSFLSFTPASNPGGFGMSPNTTSWGGNIIFVEGVYHLYVAQMAFNCSLNTWTSNSQCLHATAATIDGPFIEQDVAVGVWCHNPQVVMDTSGPSPTYWLFHIGEGNGGSPKHCNTSEAMMLPGGEQAVGAKAAGSTLHMATSPSGPWVPVGTGPNGGSCNNPAPWRLTNGTWMIICNGDTLLSGPGAAGPWIVVNHISASGKPVAGTYEDPYLFVDPRGNWHLLYHVYTTDVVPSCVNSTVSGHYFSVDGLKWTTSPDAPYGNLIQFADGSEMLVSTRERPKLVFDSAGNPTHLLNGVCGGTSNCAAEGTPCVNCKYNFWTFTLVAPLLSA